MRRLIFECDLQLVTPLLNQWQNMHWAKRKKLKNDWGKVIFWKIREMGARPPKAEEGEHRLVVVERRSVGKPDRHNAIGGAGKVVLDPMCRVKHKHVGNRRVEYEGSISLIYDDDPEHCKLEVNCVKVSKREEQGTKIQVFGGTDA